MSDYRAIADVTRTLQNMLQRDAEIALPGASVLTARPEKDPVSSAPGVINIYLYQISPNPNWRNAELPVRSDGGNLIQRPQMAIDLHYLLSFYGDEKKLIPQLLLGMSLATLHAHPHPSIDDLPRTLDDEGRSSQGASGLEEQFHLLRFMPLSLSYEELSKLWSVFFQVPYALSVAYCCSVVLLEPEEAVPIAPMPMHHPPALKHFPLAPQLDSVSPQRLPYSRGARLTLEGPGLDRGATQVFFGNTATKPVTTSDNTVITEIPPDLSAGVQTVRVAGKTDSPNSSSGKPPMSNPAAFVLQPTIVGDPQASRTPGAESSSASIALGVAPKIEPHQKVSLLLNEMRNDSEQAKSYSFRVPPANRFEGGLSVSVQVPAGTYLLRVQVDGVTSPLAMDEDPTSATLGRYIGPQVTVP